MAQPEWQDAMPMLREGCAALQAGEIMISPRIPLVDAMGAIKVMDPRMDMGVSLPSETAQPAFLPTTLLLPEEVISIIDQSLACEMTWHTGHNLLQTVYTSLYLHEAANITLANIKAHNQNIGDPKRPPELVGLVLRSYMLGMAKCCDNVWSELIKGYMFENEDVNTERADMPLYEEVTVDDVLESLDEAYGWLESRADDDYVGRYRGALMERIRFRVEYLFCLTLFHLPPSHLTVFNSHSTSAISALQNLPSFTPSTVYRSTTYQTIPVQAAFDNSICRRLASNMPPRTMEMMTIEEGRLAALELVTDLERVVEMRDGQTVLEWQRFFEGFGRRKTPAVPFIRSFMISFFCTDNLIAADPTGRRNLKWLGCQYLLESVGFDAAPLLRSHRDLDQWVSILAGTIVSYFSLLATNRCRSKRKLATSLESWRRLYYQSLEISRSIPTAHRLPSAILYIYLSIYTEIIFSGFDLELYEPFEHRIMWWALSKVINAQSGVLDGMFMNASGEIVKGLNGVYLALSSAALLISLAETSQSSNPLTIPTQLQFDRRFKWLRSATVLPTSVLDHITFSGFQVWEEGQLKRPREDLLGGAASYLANGNEGLRAVGETATSNHEALGISDVQIHINSLLAASRMLQSKLRPTPMHLSTEPNTKTDRALLWFGNASQHA